MPRLSHNTYCELRSFLASAWDQDQTLFALVCGADQWDVHRFFAPTVDLTDQELRAHRIKVSTADPSLPSRASKLARKMHRFHNAAKHLPKEAYRPAVFKHSSQGSPISVRAIMNPEPNYRLLAKAFISLAEAQLAEQRSDDGQTLVDGKEV